MTTPNGSQPDDFRPDDFLPDNFEQGREERGKEEAGEDSQDRVEQEKHTDRQIYVVRRRRRPRYLRIFAVLTVLGLAIGWFLAWLTKDLSFGTVTYFMVCCAVVLDLVVGVVVVYLDRSKEVEVWGSPTGSPTGKPTSSPAASPNDGPEA